MATAGEARAPTGGGGPREGARARGRGWHGDDVVGGRGGVTTAPEAGAARRRCRR